MASLDFDNKNKKITGINAIDIKSKKLYKIKSRAVFLCASTVASIQILFNSKSHSMPNGLGNNYDILGRYLMDHTFGTGATGILPFYNEYIEYGRRPTGMYIPRFRNLKNDQDKHEFVRGYNFQSWGQGRVPPQDINGFGEELKNNLRIPGPWRLPLYAFCEILPRKSNRILVDDNKVDQYGIPQVKFEFEWSENEINMLKDATEQAELMLKAQDAHPLRRGASNLLQEQVYMKWVGRGWEMIPKKSIVNRYNQTHFADNLFITDGSAMTSASSVNPSITYMAMTARAANYASDQIKRNKI